MKYRKLGRTGWDVSEIGYGGWGIGRNWWGPTDDKASLEALQAAWDAGITFYDTAFVYGDGHSEELMGTALAGKPARIATKIPPKNGQWPGNPDTPLDEVFPSDWIINCTERSLRKLKRDTIDLTQFHVWSDAWLTDGRWKKTVEQLKREGKIRAFGVSINDHDPDSALELVESGFIDTVQVIFNIFDQSPLEKLFPACRAHNVGVIVRVPLDEGGLSGTLTKDTKFEKGDFRGQYFRGDNLVQTVKRAEKLKTLLNKDTPTLADLALKFVLSQSVVSTVIVGMRTVQHVQLNSAVSAQPPLPAKLASKLAKHAWPRNFYGTWDV
jgi:aryl-alcohol dehydrogenase-like predicted oxidoreductase